MSARRECGQPAYAKCESKLRKYGMIVTYGSTSVNNIKVAGASNYPRGVALADTEDPFSPDTFTTSRLIAYAKEGTVQVFCRGTHPSINVGDAIQADASGCGTLLPKTHFLGTSMVDAFQSMVGITENALASNVSGFIDVYLKLHTVAKP